MLCGALRGQSGNTGPSLVARGAPGQRRLRQTESSFPMGTSMALRILIVVLLSCALGVGAIVKADTRDTLIRAAAPDTATLAGAVRDSAIRWQFDTHG